jgi:CubicO group peptidase (beta-lactamase class C family)
MSYSNKHIGPGGFALIVFACFPALSSALQETSPQEAASIEAKVDEYLAPYLEMGNFSGSVLIAKGNEILMSKGYGKASFELNAPATPQTSYCIGSLAKQFTAAAVMQLAEKGLLSVDDPIKKYLPKYKYGDQITIHHLLTHTSGVPEIPFAANSEDSGSAKDTYKDVYEQLNKTKLYFKPGSRYLYSNTGYFLLNLIVESATGKTIDIYNRDNIFAPLGMESTVYDDGSVIPGRATGYFLNLQGPIDRSYFTTFTPGAPYSTVEDFYRWIRGLLDGKILSRASFDTMITKHTDFYGYAWIISESEDGRLLWHGGTVAGFKCIACHLVEKDLTVIVFSNIFNFPRNRIANDLIYLALGRPYQVPTAHKQIELDLGGCQGFPGVYQSESGSLAEIRLIRDSLYLLLEPKGNDLGNSEGGQYLLFPESETEFFLKDINAQVEFAVDAGGKTRQIDYTVNGKRFALQKINQRSGETRMPEIKSEIERLDPEERIH